MASGSRIESGTGSGRRSALPAVLALLLATCACGSNAAAASPERARPWLGCYRITVGPSAHDLLGGAPGTVSFLSSHSPPTCGD